MTKSDTQPMVPHTVEAPLALPMAALHRENHRTYLQIRQMLISDLLNR
jgi:hypothetical protein